MMSVEQNLIQKFPSTVNIHSFHYSKAGEAARRICTTNPPVIGLSIRISQKGAIDLIALAESQDVYLIDVKDIKGVTPPALNLRGILGRGRLTIASFEMAHVALYVYRDLNEHVQGVDLSTLLSLSTRTPWKASKFIAQKVFLDANRTNIDQLWEGDVEAGHRETCLRAWISAKAAEVCLDEISVASPVNTRLLSPKNLDVISNLARQAYLLRKDRPKVIENEFNNVEVNSSGEVMLHNSRYKSRARPSYQTSIVMTNEHGDEIIGRASRAEGKTTTVLLKQGALKGHVTRIRIVGREELTSSERARDEFVLLLLKGKCALEESSFIRDVWFPSIPATKAPVCIPARGLDSNHTTEALNQSQRRVIDSMLSDEVPVVIAHGPPGTGKTSTISAAVKIWDDAKYPVWVVAQSNVAVKNLAESFLKKDIDFKLLVSKEFYVEWHEHIYEKIQHRLIRSDELPDDISATDRALGSSPIILCTLSMLSNQMLDERGVFKLIPVERLVIDEASQIDVAEYMHLFHKFKKLQKVCFFGDPKQLPPYGKESVDSIQSVFEIKHLKIRSHFLNIQYRMPVPLGDFISEYVYNKKLLSKHHIQEGECVTFVDVTNGREERCGTSWRNQAEIHTIVHLVRHYYKHRDFCIITPYDAQRGAIERQLKAENLPWERVFNVDSFQGNESLYVIISVVRTDGVGFLSSMNRVNVMLTRCQQGMIVVTNRTFLRTTAAHTLLGDLARHWSKLHGTSNTWKHWKEIVEHKAPMPGTLAHLVLPIHSPNSLENVSQKQGIGAYFPVTSETGTLNRNAIREPTIENNFPNLVRSENPKSVTQGRWSRPTNVHPAIIRNVRPAASTQPGSLLTPSNPQSPRHATVSSLYSKVVVAPSNNLVKDLHVQFPALGGKQVVRKVGGRWENGSAHAKSLV